MVCILQISPYNWITCPLFIYLLVCLLCPLLSEIPRNNQFEWIAVEAGKGEFVVVKHRRPKAIPSHTDTLPEESSIVEMTKQADTHQANRPLLPFPEDGCAKSYMMHGRLKFLSINTLRDLAKFTLFNCVPLISKAGRADGLFNFCLDPITGNINSVLVMLRVNSTSPLCHLGIT